MVCSLRFVEFFEGICLKGTHHQSPQSKKTFADPGYKRCLESAETTICECVKQESEDSHSTGRDTALGCFLSLPENFSTWDSLRSWGIKRAAVTAGP